MHRKTSIALSLSLTMLLSLFATSRVSTKASSTRQKQPDDSALVAMPQASGTVHYIEDGRTVCREATPAEAQTMIERDPGLVMQDILSASEQIGVQAAGIKIILRGTQQLNNSPQAKQAVLKAAAKWESLIQTPITVIVDVDFGPTRFGKPFGEGLLAETAFQNIAGFSQYPRVRERLILGASSSEEGSLYNSLPALTVPTELGDTTNIFGPATLFRALGMLNAVADPDQEKEFGPPPSIGFNSAHQFDFDPSDGIDSDKFDFDGLALHEMGHLLGFFSMSGNKEEFPTAPVGVSVWDLFRFRPGITLSSFPSSQRALSSGGRHIFFDGGSETELSTGRHDSTGGDQRQSHHWKDNVFSGRYIGVMDPTLDLGIRLPITQHDLAAVDAMGYQVAREGDEPIIRALSAALEGDVLTLTVRATDSQGDIAQAQVKLLDDAGQTVAQTAPFAVSVGTSTEADFLLKVTNLRSFPTVVHAVLTLIDRQGKTSEPVAADFSHADSGGPVLSSALFSGSKLKIKGKGLLGNLQLEINGVIVASGANDLKKKVVIKGNPSSLNLRSGPNRVRVRNNALWSNILIASI